MIAIEIYKDGKVYRNILVPSASIEIVIGLLTKYPLEDVEGEILKAHEVRVDIGSKLPKISIFTEVHEGYQ
jgi:hypothetical protein